MNICVVGGGNMGATLAADLACLHPDYSICLLTSKPEKFSNPIQVNDVERNTVFFGTISCISSDPATTVKNADIVFITHPSFMIESTFQQIKDFVKTGAYIGVIPGFGGCEFYQDAIFDSSVTLFGCQRVPYIVRMKEYGRISDLTSRKSELFISCRPISRLDKLCSLLEDVLHVPCISVPNYLAITLTPSNPILHTARIYDLFGDVTPDTLFPRNPKFYSEWTDHASEILLGMDHELQNLCQVISDLDLSFVVSLKKHYESETAEKMTEKMNSIESLKNIESPMISTKDGYLPDIHSRYFIEDVPFGLCVIKGFCDIYNVLTPTINLVLNWYEKFVGVEYFVDGEFIGKDLKYTAIPQNFGIQTPEDVVQYYGGNIQKSICPPPLLITANYLSHIGGVIA